MQAELLPALLPAQIGRIGILLELGRLDEAEEAIAAVRKIYPNDPRTLYLEAIAKGRRGAGRAGDGIPPGGGRPAVSTPARTDRRPSADPVAGGHRHL